MKNKSIILAVCILLLISLMAGCNSAQRPEPQTPAQDQQGIDRDRVTDENNITDNNKPIMDNKTTTDNMSERADRIVREVENVNDVKKAAVVITEGTALVGIDLTSGTKGELNSRIKQDVENAVKKADKDITKVSVTADPDIFTRIENIAKDIGEGRPLSGFSTEIEEIMRRIIPGA